MNNYVGCVCSVCNKPFAAGDDIVVCPECGTPYHRACYQAAGGCVHEAQHAEGYAWQPPPQHAQQVDRIEGFRDDNRRRRRRYRRHINSLFQRHQQFFSTYDADNFIQFTATYREQTVR